MTFPSDKIRQDFPILHQEINGNSLIFLDNGASAQKPKQVIDAISHYYEKIHANIHRGVYELSGRATKAYEDAREVVKDFIHANHAEEIIFLRGTTEAINLVAQSYGRAFLKKGDEIIITEMEHHSNIVPWQMLRDQIGIKLQVVNVLNNGELDLDHYAGLLNKNTKLVAITHVSNLLGTINPVKEMIKQAHQYHVPVLLDGAQAAPHFSVDVQALDCDFYTFSGHKLYGPTGIGVLYGKRDLLEKMPPYQGGGDMISRVTFAKTEYNKLPYKFEAGTPHIAGVIGLAEAIRYLQAIGMGAIVKHEDELLEYATEKLMGVPHLKIIGQAKNKIATISFNVGDIHAHDVGTVLDFEGIAIRAGHHCAMPLIDRFKVPATARASFGIYNTKEEVDKLVKALLKVNELFEQGEG